MRRFRGGLVFWVLLLVSVVGSSTLLAKALYQAKVRDANSAQVGNAVIMPVVVSQKLSYNYMAQSFALPGQVVTQVWLAPAAGGWTVPLCTNGGDLEDDCTYALDGPYIGNLDIEGAISPALLSASGVPSYLFNSAISTGALTVHYAGELGELASGPFVLHLF